MGEENYVRAIRYQRERERERGREGEGEGEREAKTTFLSLIFLLQSLQHK